jgi:Domain of unknown function (DUF4865)
MIIAQYGHRLPVGFDIDLIRTRAKDGGPLWDTVPELYFKGFLLREKGCYGAIASSYSSLYLWRQGVAFRDFLVSPRYRFVTDTFGRPEIQTRFALDVRRGHGRDARFVYKEELDLPLDADIATACAREIDRNREISGQSGLVAAIVGFDTQNWKFTRIVLSEHEPTGNETGDCYQILYLAQPLLETLPYGEAS